MWTVRLSHAAASGGFSILDAKLDFYGDVIGNDDTHYFTASYAALVAHDANRASIVDGNGGNDTLNFAAAAAAVLINLEAGALNQVGATAFVTSGEFENVVGSIQDDRIIGSAAANRLAGDYGNDTIWGGGGADQIDGGAGIDTAAFSHAVTLDFLNGTHGGEAAGDSFANIEAFQFSDENDFFFGTEFAINDRVLGRRRRRLVRDPRRQ